MQSEKKKYSEPKVVFANGKQGVFPAALAGLSIAKLAVVGAASALGAAMFGGSRDTYSSALKGISKRVGYEGI